KFDRIHEPARRHRDLHLLACNDLAVGNYVDRAGDNLLSRLAGNSGKLYVKLEGVVLVRRQRAIASSRTNRAYEWCDGGGRNQFPVLNGAYGRFHQVDDRVDDVAGVDAARKGAAGGVGDSSTLSGLSAGRPALCDITGRAVFWVIVQSGI